MKPHSLAIAVVLAIYVTAGPARAQETTASRPPQGWPSEMRVGLLAHDQAPIVDNVESGMDLNLEVLFEGTSLAYAGLTWEYNFRPSWFVDGSVGLAVHDGDPLQEDEQTLREAETEKAMGCRVVFHLGVGAGYRISPHWNVAAHYEHLSNGTICGSNEGLENIGIRIGRVF
jgi:hypothetical protein